MSKVYRYGPCKHCRFKKMPFREEQVCPVHTALKKERYQYVGDEYGLGCSLWDCAEDDR